MYTFPIANLWAHFMNFGQNQGKYERLKAGRGLHMRLDLTVKEPAFH